MATHSSILAWRIPWTEEPGGLQSMESQESDTTEVNQHTQIAGLAALIRASNRLLASVMKGNTLSWFIVLIKGTVFLTGHNFPNLRICDLKICGQDHTPILTSSILGLSNIKTYILTTPQGNKVYRALEPSQVLSGTNTVFF